jgi:hypothetical protein
MHPKLENTRVNAGNKRNNSSSVLKFSSQENAKMLNLYRKIRENTSKIDKMEAS